MCIRDRSEWGERDWSEASELVRRIPQIRKAEAEINSAQAHLKQAQKNLSRARVLAPFDGRIIRTMVDRGQRVGGGSSAALAEVMLWMLLKLIFLLARKKSHSLALSMVHLKALPFKLRPWTIREMHCTVDYWTDHKESLTQRPG